MLCFMTECCLFTHSHWCWSRHYLLVFFFFFFQAEDGIRDWSVIGVQTCALPISSVRPFPLRELRASAAAGLLPEYGQVPGRRSGSEERRVGKECRSRWSTYH